MRCLSLCAVLVACAHQGGAGLVLPENFDDRRLEAALAGARPRAVLAVLPFEAGAASARGLGITDMVTTALVKSGRIDLVEREKLERILEEQRFRLTGAVDDASNAAEVGKLLGAEAVVFGAVSNATQQTTDKFAYDLIRTEVRIDARAVDTTTGRVLLAEAGQGASEAKIIRSADGMMISGLRDAREEFRKAAEDASSVVARRFARLFPLLGFVLSSDGDRVIMNLGADSGVGVGDEMVAFRPGRRLVHPVTHEQLGFEKQLLDVLVVRAVEGRSSVLARRNEGAAPIRAGDVVVWRGEGR